MYFTSLVTLPRGVDPEMSVCRPGIELDDGQTNLNALDLAREVQSYSPVPLPDSPDFKPYLQNIKQEHREPDSVDVGEFNHG